MGVWNRSCTRKTPRSPEKGRRAENVRCSSTLGRVKSRPLSRSSRSVSSRRTTAPAPVSTGVTNRS